MHVPFGCHTGIVIFYGKTVETFYIFLYRKIYVK